MGTGAEDMSTTQQPEALAADHSEQNLEMVARWYMIDKDGMATRFQAFFKRGQQADLVVIVQCAYTHAGQAADFVYGHHVGHLTFPCGKYSIHYDAA